MKIRIERGRAKTVTVAADTATLKNSSAQIWVVKNNYQNTLSSSLTAGQTITLGPYINTVEFDIISSGTVTVADAATDFGDPVVVSGSGSGSSTGRVVQAAGAITMLSTDGIVEVNKTVGEATTVNPPVSPTSFLVQTVKDGKGDAATNNITIIGTFDDLTNYVISNNNGAVSFYWNGTTFKVVA